MTRMARAGALALALVGTAAPLWGQRRASVDTTDVARLRPLLTALRDSLQPVTASIANFRRDLSSAGPETVTAKAAQLVRACARARGVLRDALPQLEPGAVPERARAAGDSLRTAIRFLDARLGEECLSGLATEGPGIRPDSLREWGPYRTAQLRVAIGRFHANSHRLADAVGFKLRTSGN